MVLVWTELRQPSKRLKEHHRKICANPCIFYFPAYANQGAPLGVEILRSGEGDGKERESGTGDFESCI